MNNLKSGLSIIILTVVLSSCMSERYRKNKENKLSKKTEKADNFLAEQAIDITQENIKKRNKKEEKARKKIQKEQQEINNANAKEKNVKISKKGNIKFMFY